MPMSQDLPFDSGDLRLRWPPQLFLAVAKGLAPGGVIDRASLDRLLDEAFVDSRGLSVDPLQILVHPPTDPELTSWISGVTAAASQLLSNRYLTQLVNAVGDGSIRSYSPRRYYRERLNPVQAATPIVGQDVGAALCAVLIDLDNRLFVLAVGAGWDTPGRRDAVR